MPFAHSVSVTSTLKFCTDKMLTFSHSHCHRRRQELHTYVVKKNTLIHGTCSNQTLLSDHLPYYLCLSLSTFLSSFFSFYRSGFSLPLNSKYFFFLPEIQTEKAQFSVRVERREKLWYIFTLCVTTSSLQFCVLWTKHR